eukprot:GHVO01010132.1.p2 GENE.GHVO01010132.1~~GHVO01010132.1.p2  ORF type:complete len:106 (-),score=19.65 GHVO01010132.1:494-772(-)
MTPPTHPPKEEISLPVPAGSFVAGMAIEACTGRRWRRVLLREAMDRPESIRVSAVLMCGPMRVVEGLSKEERPRSAKRAAINDEVRGPSRTW